MILLFNAMPSNSIIILNLKFIKKKSERKSNKLNTPVRISYASDVFSIKIIEENNKKVNFNFKDFQNAGGSFG